MSHGVYDLSRRQQERKEKAMQERENYWARPESLEMRWRSPCAARKQSETLGKSSENHVFHRENGRDAGALALKPAPRSSEVSPCTQQGLDLASMSCSSTQESFMRKLRAQNASPERRGSKRA